MNSKSKQTVAIFGAGPAGLTAAYELLEKSCMTPVIYEASGHVGGLSRTVNYKGNLMDIGGHRFFSKSDRVMKWWINILPVTGYSFAEDGELREESGDHDNGDKAMLVRNRLSRILYLGNFFDYPLSLNANSVKKLGLIKIVKIAASYFKSAIFPIKEEDSLENFLINRFGKELYLSFFKDYTEKVWGVPCLEIDAEWGGQRIEGMSIYNAVMDAMKRPLQKLGFMNQGKIEKSLIKWFLYPKFGPGQLWEEVADRVQEKRGELHRFHKVEKVRFDGRKITGVEVRDVNSNETISITGDYYFSSMPIKDLIHAFGDSAPDDVREVANGLRYRDFITVGLLLEKISLGNGSGAKTSKDMPLDNWIYIQEKDVKVGRLQLFNNWSPHLVKDKNKAWIGLEYFCNEGDELWRMDDSSFIDFATGEMEKIGVLKRENVLDGVVIRVPKAYPAYFGSYNKFEIIRGFLDKIDNLFLIGRNGMHRYNNMDHSMLSAMTAVENVINGTREKDNIWSVNTEKKYHESK